DDQPAAEGTDIECPPVLSASLAENTRGVKHLVRDQRWHPKFQQLAVAILNDLYARDQFAHRFSSLLRCARARRQVAGEPRGQLALHTGAHEVREAKRRAAAMDVGYRHEPRRRTTQPEVVLHSPRGSADLEPAGCHCPGTVCQGALNGRPFSL